MSRVSVTLPKHETLVESWFVSPSVGSQTLQTYPRVDFHSSHSISTPLAKWRILPSNAMNSTRGVTNELGTARYNGELILAETKASRVRISSASCVFFDKSILLRALLVGSVCSGPGPRCWASLDKAISITQRRRGFCLALAWEDLVYRDHKRIIEQC